MKASDNIKIVHLGGKIMQYFKALRTISLILGLLASGCATSKLDTGKNQKTNEEIGLKAEAVSEGICLVFDSVPAETSRLFIMIQNWGENDRLNSTHEIIGSYSDIRGGTLEQVKQTGRIIFPFVKAGQNYNISASFENENGQTIVGSPDWIYAKCAANAGIYFNDGLKLELNKTNTGVTLSSEPEFSTEVQYAPEKYFYAVKLDISDHGSLGYSDKGTGLHWDFEPQMTNDLKEGEHLQNGNYSAYVTTYRNINYDNVTWTVEIAKTPEFIYSLK